MNGFCKKIFLDHSSVRTGDLRFRKTIRAKAKELHDTKLILIYFYKEIHSTNYKQTTSEASEL